MTALRELREKVAAGEFIALYVTHSAHDIIAPRFVCGSVVMISALWFWIDLVRMAL